nr:ATP-dependent DNA helicase PIF1-like [Tanacetum cinerariifolium]
MELLWQLKMFWRLTFHLPHQNAITLCDSKRLPALLEREGRIVYSSIASGERYYLKVLLNVVRGVEGFEQLMTVNKRSKPVGIKPTTARHIRYNVVVLRCRTAHSRFVILLELMENSTCNIKQNTQLAELMQEVQLIIWDEAPMTQRYASQALDTTLRDILGFKDTEKAPNFWGHGRVAGRSELWRYFKVFTLTHNMRVNEYSANGEINTSKQEFNRWVCAVGDGTLPEKMKEGEDEPTRIDIPEKFLIKK